MQKLRKWFIQLIILVILVTGLTIPLFGSNQNVTQQIDQSDFSDVGYNYTELTEFSTLLGGSSDEQSFDLEIDLDNNIVFVGETSSEDFNVTDQAYDTTSDGIEGILVKLAPNGSIIWSTFLGQIGRNALGLEIDNNGNYIVVGDAHYNGNYDVYVAKFHPNGTLLWSTRFGGSESETHSFVTVDSNNNIILLGTTQSTDLYVVNALYPTYSGSNDGFVTKFDPDGNVIWSTYFGGSGNEAHYFSPMVDSSDNLIFGTTSSSSNFPLKNAMDSTLNGTSDGAISKIHSNGSLLWSTFVGGNATDVVNVLDVTPNDNIVISGATRSLDFPITSGTTDIVQGGVQGTYVMKLNSSGFMNWSRLLGGTNNQGVWGIENYGEDVIVTGWTEASDFPLRFPMVNYGNTNGYLSIFSDNGTLQFSTFIGGSNTDSGKGVAMDHDGRLVAIGETYSSDFPLENAHQDEVKNLRDIYIMKMNYPLEDEDNDTLILAHELYCGTNPTVADNPEEIICNPTSDEPSITSSDPSGSESNSDPLLSNETDPLNGTETTSNLLSMSLVPSILILNTGIAILTYKSKKE